MVAKPWSKPWRFSSWCWSEQCDAGRHGMARWRLQAMAKEPSSLSWCGIALTSTYFGCGSLPCERVGHLSWRHQGAFSSLDSALLCHQEAHCQQPCHCSTEAAFWHGFHPLCHLTVALFVIGASCCLAGAAQARRLCKERHSTKPPASIGKHAKPQTAFMQAAVKPAAKNNWSERWLRCARECKRRC